MRGTNLENKSGRVKGLGKYGRTAVEQGSPEVNDHEFKTQPISMVMSFYPNSSPMWVQVK